MPKLWNSFNFLNIYKIIFIQIAYIYFTLFRLLFVTPSLASPSPDTLCSNSSDHWISFAFTPVLHLPISIHTRAQLIHTCHPLLVCSHQRYCRLTALLWSSLLLYWSYFCLLFIFVLSCYLVVSHLLWDNFVLLSVWNKFSAFGVLLHFLCNCLQDRRLDQQTQRDPSPSRKHSATRQFLVFNLFYCGHTGLCRSIHQFKHQNNN